MYDDKDYRPRKDNVYIKEDIDFQKRAEKRKIDYEMDKEKVKERLIRQSMPKMEESKIQTLRLNGDKVIGSIFDRVKFLELRIAELTESIELRKKLHADMTKNIEVDIGDKESMGMLVSDHNEKRNLKMDISILRKEKRNEQLQFWKDTTELMTELRTIYEQYETEKKIASLFAGEDNE